MLTWPLLLQLLQLHKKPSLLLWNYQDTTTWKDYFPLCAGPLQSPIDLKPSGGHAKTEQVIITYPPDLTTGEIVGINTGRAIELFMTPENISVPLMEFTFASRPQFGTYRFEKMVWHWGEGQGKPGSEHTLDGRFFDAEVQMMFYSTKYGSFKEAQKYPGAIAAVAVMVNGAQSPPVNPIFPTFQIDLVLEDLAAKDSKIHVSADLEPMKAVMNAALARFYGYHGSLTAPPCSPVVLWMVSAMDMEVELEFLIQLHAEIFEDETFSMKLVNNRRPVQPSKGRVVHELISPP